MIALFPDGTWNLKCHLCSCDSCKWRFFDKCSGELSNQMVREDVIDEDLDSLDETDDMDPEMYTSIEKGSYIALYSSCKSFELFYTLKLLKKAVAEQDIIDIYGHRVQKNSSYIEGVYLEKTKEKDGKVFYKELKKNCMCTHQWYFVQLCQCEMEKFHFKNINFLQTI